MNHPIDKAALAEAVEMLILDPDAPEMFQWVNRTYELARRGVPVRLVDRGAVLNPLLLLWLDDDAKYANVLDLINRKRDERGLTPLDEGTLTAVRTCGS